MDKVFQSLSSSIRRKILSETSKKDLTNSQIVGLFNVSGPTISKHLSTLLAADLISSERKGQYVYYKANRENVMNCFSSYISEIYPELKFKAKKENA